MNTYKLGVTMNTYKHLTKEERHLIYLLWNKEKYSMNKI